MNCKTWQRCLSPYIDGVLDVERTGELERHLDACSECRFLYRSMLLTDALLATEEPVRAVASSDTSATDDWVATIAANAIRAVRSGDSGPSAIRGDSGPSAIRGGSEGTFWDRFFPIAWPAAAVVVTLAIGLLLFTSGQPIANNAHRDAAIGERSDERFDDPVGAVTSIADDFLWGKAR